MPFPSISGLTLRLESDLGITKDGSNRVATWADQAAVYGNFTQATDDNKPVHTANVFGTASGLLFDGVNDVLTNASAISNMVTASQFEMFLVVRNAALPAALRPFWCTDNATATNNVKIGHTSSAGTFAVYNKPSSTQTNAPIAGFLKNKAYCLNAKRYTGSFLNLMDALAVSKDSGNITDAADTSATALAYGSYLGREGSNYTNFYFGALICFNRVLTVAERKQVSDYLIATYNVQYPAMYVDQTSGDDSTGDGLSMSTAYKTWLLTAPKIPQYAYGTRVIFRNAGSEDTARAASSSPYGSSAKDPNVWMNWSRPSIGSLTANFTNGSTYVSAISGITFSEEAHTDRYITAPDGKQYNFEKPVVEIPFNSKVNGGFAVGDVIYGVTSTYTTQVVAILDNGNNTGVYYCTGLGIQNGEVLKLTNTSGQQRATAAGNATQSTSKAFLVQKYMGTTVNSGTFTIQADEDYSYCQALNTYDGADAKATWNADGHVRPKVYNTNSASGSAAMLSFSAPYWKLKNFVIGDDARVVANGYLINFGLYNTVTGFMFLKTTNYGHIYINNSFEDRLRKCHFRGSNNASNANCYPETGTGENYYFEDIGISDCYYSFQTLVVGGSAFFKNCSLGYNGQSKTGKELVGYSTSAFPLSLFASNCIFHPLSIEFTALSSAMIYNERFYSENHNGVYGLHKQIIANFCSITNTTTGVTLPADEQDGVLDIFANLGSAVSANLIYKYGKNQGMDSRITAYSLFEQKFRVPAGTYNVQWLVNAQRPLRSDEIWIEAEYLSAYDNTTSFQKSFAQSQNEIAQATNDSDWSQYCGVTITVVAGNDGFGDVIIRAFAGFYEPTYHVYASKKFRCFAAKSLTYMDYGRPMFMGIEPDFPTAANTVGPATTDHITGTAIRESHTANQIVHSAGGNVIDETIIPENIKNGIVAGLNVTGTYSGGGGGISRGRLVNNG